MIVHFGWLRWDANDVDLDPEVKVPYGIPAGGPGFRSPPLNIWSRTFAVESIKPRNSAATAGSRSFPSPRREGSAQRLVGKIFVFHSPCVSSYGNFMNHAKSSHAP